MATLSAGTRLGPYEVVGLIGAGGMGEVYRARDTRLDRTVAVKVLPSDLAGDPERRSRLEREARTISGLNHPNICTLHDVGEADGRAFLVMEHLVGETLAERLKKGPLPLEQALTIATEIADALAAAHRQGVVHRDLKPGNVMLTKSGAKLLDFGLAKLTGHGEHPAAARMTSATRSTPLTGEGVIVGTLQYMAPEQLEGKAADARTDLWALGTILYEMVTGQRAFEGTSSASLIGAILEREPAPASTLRASTPPGVDRLVTRCLAKDPEERWASAHDVADELRWIGQTSGTGAVAGAQPRRRRVLRLVLVVAGGLAMVIASAAVGWLLRPSTPRPMVARVSLGVEPAEALDGGALDPLYSCTPGGSRTALTWTPDGQAVVFVGRREGVRHIYVRRLEAAEARPLANTEGAQTPAVSPDGQWVAFWANGAIRKVPVGGGPVTDLAAGVGAPPWGLVWDAAGRLFFGQEAAPIWQIPVEGPPAPVTTLGEAEVAHGLPSTLPGARALLYTVRRRERSWGDEVIVAQTLAGGARKVLLRDAVDARYVASGHLVFLRRGVLFAVPFDPERLQVLGKEVPVVETVAQTLVAGVNTDITGAGQFAVSASGTLAWVPGPVERYPDLGLVSVDRVGHVTPLPAPVRSYGPALRLSPDGRRLAVVIYSLTETGLWVYDLDRGTLTPLNRDGEVASPIWSPDGRRIVFDWLRDGRRSLAAQPADGSAPPAVLVKGGFSPSSFAPDGGRLAAVRGGDVVLVSGDRQATLQSLIETRATELWPELSPDGRWLAYGSDASGRFDVYVRSSSRGGTAEPVSVEGGWSPAWHPNGRELFFVTPPDAAGKRRMMAAGFSPGSPPSIGRPHPLFEYARRDLAFSCHPVRCHDVAPDGQRFYAVQIPAPTAVPVVTHIDLVQNWVEELKAKVPSR